MEDKKVTLTDVLKAKEDRKARQDSARERYKTALASITINVPGPVKDGPAIRKLCDYAVARLKSRLTVLAEDRIYPVTGPEALLAVKEDAVQVKNIAVETEEEYPFGRLLDIDVFSAEGQQLSRDVKRRCLVCGDLAILCMRERRHPLPVVQAAVQHLLDMFSAYSTRNISPEAEKLGALAVEALLYEVACTPAPGLVDRNNSGAHTDMDFYTFMASSAALSLTMARCAQAGIAHGGPPVTLLPVLRVIGREGEQAMHSATCGVNTHKGLLFSLGLVAAAAGWLQARAHEITPETVLEAAAQIAQGLVRELEDSRNKDPNNLTAGERLYRQYGITGIRGQMEAGLPAVRRSGLPALRAALAAGLGVNEALVHTLLVLMTCVEDTTVMNRHNPEKMRVWVRSRAEAALAAGGMYTAGGRDFIARLDEEFILHNVSPGGTADLLAVTWFIHRLTDTLTANAVRKEA